MPIEFVLFVNGENILSDKYRIKGYISPVFYIKSNGGIGLTGQVGFRREAKSNLFLLIL